MWKAESEVPGQPVERDVQVTRQGPFDAILLPEVDLVALEEGGLVGLVHIQRHALRVCLMGEAVGLEQRGEDGGDRVRFAGGFHADPVE